MIDIHSHILPMLDDGPTTVQESMEMCRIAVHDGIKKIVATPHVENSIFDVNAQTVLEKVNMLNQLIQEAGLDLTIYPGAEVHLNDRLINENIIKESPILTINGNKTYILLEFSFQWIPTETEQVIFKLKSMGLTPILPHLERNNRIQENRAVLQRFVDMGAILQVTAQSFTGGFGNAPRKCVLWMLKNNLVHVVASDAHSPVNRPPILSQAVKIVSDVLDEETAHKMVSEYPKMILEGISFDR